MPFQTGRSGIDERTYIGSFNVVLIVPLAMGPQALALASSQTEAARGLVPSWIRY